MWIDLSIWVKDLKIFVFHVNAHQRMTSAEEEFNTQVDRMTHSGDGHSLSHHSCISQWVHEQSGFGGRVGVYVWALQHGLPLIKADLATTAAKYQINTEPQIQYHSPG